MVFCVYVAARVIVQHQVTRPDDQAVQSSLEFLVSAMRALKKKHPLAASFSAQLELDIAHRAITPLNIHSTFMLRQHQAKCVRITTPTTVALGILH